MELINTSTQGIQAVDLALVAYIQEGLLPMHAVLHNKYITGADPGLWERGGPINIFTTGGGNGRGRAPSRDCKGVWGSADSSPSGVWGGAPAAFCFCVYLAQSDIQ